MTAPLRLPAILAASRTIALRTAIVARLTSLFPDFKVEALPGKVDVSDVLAGEVYTAPSILVAVVRTKPDPRMSGSEDVVASIAAYIVAEDRAIAGRRYGRDEIGYATAEALAKFLAQPNDQPMWGLQNLGLPEEIEAQPLFTAKTIAKGVAFYATSWRQELFAMGDPLFGGGDDV